MSTKVTLDMDIEELVAAFPEAVGFLTRNGVRCVRCGEPVWGTLGGFLQEEEIENPQELVDRLNDYIKERREDLKKTQNR